MRALNAVKYSVTLLGLVALLSGCVTTRSGAFNDKADQEKALSYSVQLARQYIAQRDWNAAKRHLKYALEVDEDRAETHEALAMVFENTGELELAEKHFRKAIAEDGKLTRARNNYAVFLYNLERYEEAADQLDYVVQDVLYEQRFNAFLNLGRCYLQLQKFERAHTAFNRAHLMDKEAPTALFGLAKASFGKGDYAESQRWYEHFRARVKAQSAGSLWLGIRLADRFGDRDASASYGLALKSLYPRSQEYLAYQQYLEQGGSPGVGSSR